MLRLVLTLKCFHGVCRARKFIVCALREDLRNLTLDSFNYALTLLFSHAFHFFFNAGLHLGTILRLLTDCDLVACIHKCLDVVL